MVPHFFSAITHINTKSDFIMKNLANKYYKPLAKNFININNPTLSLINLFLNND